MGRDPGYRSDGKKKSRLWLEGGRPARLKPRCRGHVRCCGFTHGRTGDGRPAGIPAVVDEYTGEALAARAGRTFPSRDVVGVPAGLVLTHGPPEHIRSDNGPGFIALRIRNWLSRNGVRTVCIKPGAPCTFY